MKTRPEPDRVRLWVAAGCVVLVSYLYVRALGAEFSHNGFHTLLRPWRNLRLDVLVFSLCTAALLVIAPVIRKSTRWQQVAGILLSTIPVLVLVHSLLRLLVL